MNRATFVLSTLAGAALIAACADILGIQDVPDGALGDGAATDAHKDAGIKCSPTTPFGVAQPIIITGVLDSDIVLFDLSPDQLTVFVTTFDKSSMPYTYAVNSASRLTAIPPTSSFGLDGVLQEKPAVGATTPSDGLSVIWQYYTDAGPTHLMRATRNNVSQTFGPQLSLSGLFTDAGGETRPYLLPNGQALYYTVFTTAGNVIFVATPAGNFSDPTPISGLSPNAGLAIVSPDELVMYFNRVDIRVATRTNFNEFQEIGIVIPYATNTALIPVAITSDLCTFYYQEKTISPNSSTLFVATKTH